MRPRPQAPERLDWNVLTRPVETWRLVLDGDEHEVTLVQRITLLEAVFRRDRALPHEPTSDGSRLSLVAPRVRSDVLVNGRSHTGPAWGPPNSHARERTFRIFGHRAVVRLEPRAGMPPECSLFVDDALVAPVDRRPKRRGLRRSLRELAAAALAGVALGLLAAASLAFVSS